jgi:hypothetical protein
MMAKERGERPQDPAELLADIRDALAGKVKLRVGAPKRVTTRAHAPAAPVSRKNKRPYFVAVGVAAVVLAVIVGVIALSGLGGGQPAGRAKHDEAAAPSEASKESTRQPSDAAREAKGSGQHAEARAGQAMESALKALTRQVDALSAKDQFGEALSRVEAFAQDHPAGADDAQKLTAQVLATARRRYDALAANADAAAKAKEFAKARDALKPALAFGIPELTERARKKLEEIASREQKAELWARWDDVKAEATRLAEAGRFAEALQALQKAEGLPLGGSPDLVAEQTQAIEDARGKATEAAAAAYTKESDRLWTLFKERKYEEAKKLLADLAAKPEFRLAEDLVSADREAVRLLSEFWAVVERGIAARKGQFIAFAGAGGTILGVEDGVVTIKGPRGEERRHIHRLAPKQALAYADLEDDERSNHMKGVFLLAEAEELGMASDALEAAGDLPGLSWHKKRLHLAVDRARVATEAKERVEIEAAAERTWRAISSAAKSDLAMARAKSLLTRLQGFQETYQATHFYESVQKEVGNVRAQIEEAAEGWQRLFDGRTLGDWEVVTSGGFAKHGEVRAENGMIILEPGAPFTGIAWTGSFPRVDYELVVEAMRVAGRDCFCGVTFPVGEQQCHFGVGAWQGVRTGIEFVDGLGIYENGTARRIAVTLGRWYQVRLRVTRTKLEGWVDGEKVLDQSVPGHRFSPHVEWGRLAPVGLGAWATKAAVRRIAFRPVR